MRRWLWLLAIVAVAGLGVAIYLLKPVNGPARDLTLAGDASRGAYLIRVGGCVSCHTNAKASGGYLAGGVPLETPFGTFITPNITPHPEAGLGGWTLAQFSDAMSNGVGPGGGHLYPAFPYTSYTMMTDQDMVDLWAGLQAVPPLADRPPAHQVAFPFNVRLANLAWKNLFFQPRRFTSDPAKSEAWNRGAYLANGPAHCVECHSPRNPPGALEPGKEYTGSPGGVGGRAPAITAQALAENGYDETTLIEALKTGFTPDFDVLGGPMAEEIADSTSHWTDEDLAAVAAYLLDR